MTLRGTCLTDCYELQAILIFLHFTLSSFPPTPFSAIFLSYILIHHLPTISNYLSFLCLLLSILPLPLHFCSLPQMESLFGSLPEMLDFQRVFLQTLEERIASSPDFSTLETPSQFKVRYTHTQQHIID